MDLRYDLGVVPSGNREELQRRVVDRAAGDEESTTVLLLNRDTFESMFAQEGVRVMVSDLVPAGFAFVLDLEALRQASQKPAPLYVVNGG